MASSGTDNALFRLGDDRVVRLPRAPWAVDDVAKEQRWLPHLAPHLPLAVPVPLALGLPGEGYPWAWSVYAWLPGTDAATTPPEDLRQAAADLAAFLVALRGVPAPEPVASSRTATLASRDDATRAAAVRLGLPEVLPVWERALAADPWPGPPVWVHGDLTPGNLLVRDGRLAGVLDLGALGTGDPAVDLVPSYDLLDAAARAVYLDRLGLDDAALDRARGWTVSVAVIALDYYEATTAIARRSRHALEQVLSG